MSPEYNKIIDIGIVSIKNMEIVDTWETLIDPQQELDPWITYYTSIRTTHLIGKPLFNEISEKVKKLIDRSIFVAHNVNFDYSFLKNEMAATSNELINPKLCTVKLSKRFLPNLDNFHLDAVTDHYDIDITNRHRALPDAYATAQVFIKYLKLAQEKYQVKDYFDFEKLQWNIRHHNNKNESESLFDHQYLT
jgi:DNA polymerase-3 subunit epsilon